MKSKAALCFIISYEHILQKEQLWIDWIKPNQDIINIYFHYKDINSIKSPWIKLYTIPPELIQQTSYYNVVPAYMSLLSYAFHHDTMNQWFCLLTDSCVPIISPGKFREMFFKYNSLTIMGSKPAYWDIRLHRRANLRLLNEEYWLANDPWFTLCRKHVQQCIIFLVAKNGIYEKVNNGGLANESIFAIILQTFKELTNTHTYINSSSTICDWTRMSTPTSPYVFLNINDENRQQVEKLLKDNKYAMFLRKVNKTVTDDEIQSFWEKNENEYKTGLILKLQLLPNIIVLVLLILFYILV
jgi:Core-2/I-Branching enzyme